MVDTPGMPSEGERQRRPKFTSDELEALVDAVAQHQHIIYSKCADCITNNKKNCAWKSVTDSINTVSVVLRKPDEIRRKWRDWTSIIKSKEQKRRHVEKTTGGGSRIIVMAPVEEKVVALLKESTIERKSTGSTTSTPSTSEQGSISAALPRPACSTISGRNVSRSRSRSRSPGRMSPRVRDSHSTIFCKHIVGNRRKFLGTSLRQDVTLSDDPARQLVNIERERLKVDQQRLAVEKEHLAVEKRRLAIDERKLAAIEMFINAKKGEDKSDTESFSSCLL